MFASPISSNSNEFIYHAKHNTMNKYITQNIQWNDKYDRNSTRKEELTTSRARWSFNSLEDVLQFVLKTKYTRKSINKKICSKKIMIFFSMSICDQHKFQGIYYSEHILTTGAFCEFRGPLQRLYNLWILKKISQGVVWYQDRLITVIRKINVHFFN